MRTAIVTGARGGKRGQVLFCVLSQVHGPQPNKLEIDDWQCVLSMLLKDILTLDSF